MKNSAYKGCRPEKGGVEIHVIETYMLTGVMNIFDIGLKKNG
jgi:hypothetical protein